MARTALAQVAPPGEPPAGEPPAGEPPAAVLLEQQVAERLASQGVVLSQRKLGLRIEHGQDRWTVSLIDLATAQPAAALEIGQLPPDRDAAAQILARAAANLAEHLANEVTQLEARFNTLSLRFATTYRPDRQGEPSTGSQHWGVFRGAVDQELDPVEFYRTVGREDLAASYERRRTLMVDSYLVAGLAVVIGLVVQATSDGPDFRPCAPPGQRAECDANQTPSILPVLIGAGVGLGATMVGTYFYRHPQPIDESEARSLAALYNHQLLRQLARPRTAPRPVLRDLTLRPHLVRDVRNDVGLVLGARF